MNHLLHLALKQQSLIHSSTLTYINWLSSGGTDEKFNLTLMLVRDSWSSTLEVILLA